MYKSILLKTGSTIALALVAIPSTVCAQDADAAKTASNSAKSGDIGGDIIVTATKRNENLTKVPIAISVFTEQSIREKGITRPREFLLSTPNVTFLEDDAGEAYINIRGQTAVRNSDPNVAIVIDGVTLSTVKPFNQDLFGIQQIEVLKGPQSALYGRNAAAGAIIVNTKKPGDTLEGSVIGSLGNQNTSRLSAIVSAPLAPGLGISMAGSYRNTDGPFTNVTTGEKVHRFRNYSGRGRMVYDNGAGLKLDFKVTAHDSLGGASAYNAQILGFPLGGFDGEAIDANFADMDFVSNVQGVFKEKFFDATLKVDYETNIGTFTSISSYNRLNQYFGADSPPYVAIDSGAGTIQQYTYLDKNFSQELRLSSPSGGRLTWQLGFYFLRFTRNQTSNVQQDDGVSVLPADPRQLRFPSELNSSTAYSNPLYRTTNYAPFASLKFDATDKLHITLAGRYDTEERSVAENAPDMINTIDGLNYNNCIALTGRSFAQCKSSKTFKQFQPKASISYDFVPTGSIYASFGKGFKSGGFNPIGSREKLISLSPPGSVFVQDQYDKEVSTSYEIGAKAKMFDGALSVSGAVFTTDIKGAQQFQFAVAAGLQTIISIDKVKARGFEFDFDARLPGGTHLFGGFGYTDSKIKAFAAAPQFVGNTAPGAFKTTLSLGASHAFELGNDISLTPRVEFNHYGTIWWDPDNTPGTKRNPLSLLKARLTLKKGDRWELSAYGDNLTNESYFQEIIPLLGFFTVNFRGPPRKYGFEARYNF
jgi:iron complex outermembrane receptor protein